MTRGDPTGLYDLDGREIHIGDRVRFYPVQSSFVVDSNAESVWEADVSYEDGVVTVAIGTEQQVANPAGWSQAHDWVQSNWWSTTVGAYGHGPFPLWRKPLTRIQTGFGVTQADYNERLLPLLTKYGHRCVLNLRIVRRHTEE